MDDEVDHEGRQFQSSIKVVHGRPPHVHGRSGLFKLDGRIHSTLEKFQLSIAVTKSVIIATNPSSKLPLTVTILIAVEKVNSGLVGFHKSWGGYLDK